MHRFSLLLSMAMVMLLGITTLGAQRITSAQEATPTAEEMMPEGVIFEPVSIATGIDVTSPSDLIVFRVSLDPGTAVPVDASPGVGILLVDSGTLTVQVEGPVRVTRGASLEDMEAVTAGEAVTLEAGDSAYIPGNVAGEIRNEGQEPATGQAFIVYPSEGMMGEATPAAAAAGAADAVAVSLTEFAIEMPTELTAGLTTFEITNIGTTEHNFEVEGQGIEEELPENLAPGASGMLTVDLAPGTYEVYCPVGNHEDMGMRLELTVTG